MFVGSFFIEIKWQPPNLLIICKVLTLRETQNVKIFKYKLKKWNKTIEIKINFCFFVCFPFFSTLFFFFLFFFSFILFLFFEGSLYSTGICISNLENKAIPSPICNWIIIWCVLCSRWRSFFIHTNFRYNEDNYKTLIRMFLSFLNRSIRVIMDCNYNWNPNNVYITKITPILIVYICTHTHTHTHTHIYMCVYVCLCVPVCVCACVCVYERTLLE